MAEMILIKKSLRFRTIHTTPEEFENVTINGHFGFVFEENSVREITWLTWRHRFKKLLFENVFRAHLNVKPYFSQLSIFPYRSLHPRIEWQEYWTPARNPPPIPSPAIASLAFSFACVNREVVNSLTQSRRFQISAVWRASSKSSVVVTD